VKEYQFTQDWFHWAPALWKSLIPMLPERGAFLEIGSYEGRATVWMLENMLDVGGWIDCVDTWEGGEEHTAHDTAAVEARFDYNIDVALGGAVITPPPETFAFVGTRLASPEATEDKRKRVYKYKGKSAQLLGKKLCDPQSSNVHLYDFIYVDGSHTAPDVLADAVMAWPLLKPNGLMVFDDYLWGEQRDILHRPKLAVDAFVNIYAEQANIVHVGYQKVLQKKGV
jgi:hypothetical protein